MMSPRELYGCLQQEGKVHGDGRGRKNPPPNSCRAGGVPGTASVKRKEINTSTALALLQTRAEYKPRFKNKEHFTNFASK